MTPADPDQVRHHPYPAEASRGDMNHPVWRRRLAMLTDREWTEPLPIYTYLIDHPEGLILLECESTVVDIRWHVTDS